LINELFSGIESRKLLQPHLTDELKYHGTSDVTVKMPFGTEQQVKSQWYKRTGKRGRRKPGPKAADSGRKGCHVFLDLLGFEGKVSQPLLSKALKMAILCPSAAIASNLLKDEGIVFSQNKLRDCINLFGDFDDRQRAELSCGDSEDLKGKRVLICFDGGRVRGRQTKKGRIKDGGKRHGFGTEWVEPKMFTIYILDKKGEIDKNHAPYVDGSLGGDKAFIALLKSYLQKLNISECDSVTLAGDGARWQWLQIPALLKKLKVKKEKITEIIDLMHAKQNLHKILQGCSKGIINTEKDELKKEAEELLYQGQIDKLGELIKEHSVKGHKVANKEKWESYFNYNRERMQYASFTEEGHPVGSGAIESAIRRVINLRMKSPAIFWLKENAEAMIFIRSQLLFGRWGTVMNGLKKFKHKLLLKNIIEF